MKNSIPRAQLAVWGEGSSHPPSPRPRRNGTFPWRTKVLDVCPSRKLQTPRYLQNKARPVPTAGSDRLTELYTRGQVADPMKLCEETRHMHSLRQSGCRETERAGRR